MRRATQIIMSKINLDSPDLVNRIRAGYVLSWCVCRPHACAEHVLAFAAASAGTCG